ncbi:hypothetical protein VPH35_031977 [Triticum aestivum]
MGKQSSSPQLRLVTPNEGTMTHHAAPLEGRLSDVAAKAVNELLLSGTTGNLSSLCSWADKVRFRYYWSVLLRDCKDKEGVKGRCVAGTIDKHIPAPHLGIIIAIASF